MGHDTSILNYSWPAYDQGIIKEDKITIVIQINGKVRGRITVARGLSGEEINKLALSDKKIKELTEGKNIKKTILVPGKLINIVTTAVKTT